MTRMEIEKEMSDLRYDIAMESDCFVVGCMEHRLQELEELLKTAQISDEDKLI